MLPAGTTPTNKVTKDDLSLMALQPNGIKLPHNPEGSIMIYLEVPGVSVIPMRVLESDSIASVKLRIQSCKGFVVKKQKLVFDGRELARDNCLIRDYGVANGNVLHLVIRISDLRIINVKTDSGKKFKFHIEQGRTVQHVKQLIAKKGDDGFDDLGIQKLVLDGEELDDRSLIHDICKNDDAVVHLLVCKSAKVRTKPVDKDFELSIVAPRTQEPIVANDLQTITWKTKNTDSWVEPVTVNPKVELPQLIKEMIVATCAGLEKGNSPIMSSEGTGGVYFMQDVTGHEYLSVFKPIDEEPMAVNNPRGLPLSTTGEGLKKGTRVGEGALREVAAYILDHPLSGCRSFSNVDIGFAGVPPTTMVRCLFGGSGDENERNQFKIGSLQKFVKNYGSCEDMGPRAFPVQEVHKICVLDIRLANADRHAGNILISKKGNNGPTVLIPIDHGYCLPENFEDCTFEWLLWPQSRQPFNSETIKYIRSLDAEQDIALLKFCGWEPSVDCCRTLRISTMLLKRGVERGLTPYDIGNILCRETVKKESKIEEMIRQALASVSPGSGEAVLLESISVIMDHYLDEVTL